METDGCEDLWTNIQTPYNKILISLLYKHSKLNTNLFLESLNLNL